MRPPVKIKFYTPGLNHGHSASDLETEPRLSISLPADSVLQPLPALLHTAQRQKTKMNEEKTATRGTKGWFP